MIRRHARVLWLLVLLLAFWPGRSAWAGAPSDQLRAGIERVFQILNDPGLEGDAKLPQRRVAIITVASDIFDFGEMARRSLGPYWGQRTPAERDEFVHLFTSVVQQSYISRVDQQSARTMIVQDEVPDGESVVVRTTLKVGAGHLLPLDYRMHSVNDRWKVYDLKADGVSLVASYRAQFDKVIRTSSYAGLVSRLRSRHAVASERPIATGRENAP